LSHSIADTYLGFFEETASIFLIPLGKEQTHPLFGDGRRMNAYTLQIPDEVERRLRRCRASIRAAIQSRLDGLSRMRRRPPSGPSPRTAPPCVFYVSEGYRISYRVDATSRRVVLLDLQPDSA
jgi:mRNA-degrading endonuclease RelE of RelBE toxin-antitoxin system